jgi:hypothetical protein
MRSTLSIALAIVCFVTPLQAADVSGRWTGTLGDDQNNSPALLILQQDGTKVSGTAGGDDADRHPIQNGTIEGDTLKFEVVLKDRIMSVELKVNGTELAGKVEMKRDGQVVRTGRLAVKRQ